MSGERKVPRISSKYMLLDVEKGRRALEKYLRKVGPIPVVIHATIVDAFGSDDGTSIEFNCDVERLETRHD